MATPTPTPAFWVDDTGDSMVWLRRFRTGPCPASGLRAYHNAMARVGPVIGEVVITTGPGEYDGDPRWPAACECGFVFTEDDTYQVFSDSIMVRPDTREMWPMRELPAGAMYDGHWLPWKGPDGLSLVVLCPPTGAGNDWHVDGPARMDGVTTPGAWNRTGDPRAVPPTITVNPSIEIGFQRVADGSYQRGGPAYYHGFLHDGVLTPG